MAEGWLWLSMRNAAASPSPTSTTPAFSPGPTSTEGPSVGSRRRWRRLDLYEQCSDHMTAYMASSRWLGSRPRMRPMADASSSVSPSARWIGSVAVTKQAYATALEAPTTRPRRRTVTRRPRIVQQFVNQAKECTSEKKGNKIPRMPTTTRKRTPMSNEHKAALAEGRDQGRAVRRY